MTVADCRNFHMITSICLSAVSLFWNDKELDYACKSLTDNMVLFSETVFFTIQPLIYVPKFFHDVYLVAPQQGLAYTSLHDYK